MAKSKTLSILLIFCLLVSLILPITTVYAESKNEVTLNFKGGTIHDGYVEYSKKAKLQLFKGEDLVTDISNNMVIDLNEAEYKFVIEEIEDSSVAGANTSIKLKINKWYYPIIAINETKSTFKLDSSKFNGKLDIEFERRNIAVNTTVKNVYEDISSKGVIDLTDGKEYVIDFSKNDELTEGLKSFADLDKTLYYKRDNKGLLETDNESEAVIKIVGNRSENKAILTAVNVGTKKSEVFKGFHMQYTGSALDYDNLDGDIASGRIVLETRYDYYTRYTYEFTFQYVKEEVIPKEYKFIEGANQTYIIGESKNATFKIDADYSLFTNKVYVDNKLVDPTNYDSKSGSTVITLKDEYLKTLSVGEHTLKVTFSDNGEATTKFTIKEKQQNETPEDSKNIENTGSTENTENTENTEKEEQPENNNVTNNDVQKDNTIANPKTGDNVIVYAILFAIALLGIIALVIVNNIKRKNIRKH